MESNFNGARDDSDCDTEEVVRYVGGIECSGES